MSSTPSAPPVEPLDDGQLFAVLATLDDAGVSFDLTPDPPRPPLVWTPPLAPAAAALLAPWRAWLEWVALGRYSRHAPVRCDRCGFVAMAPVVHGRATATKAAGWRAKGKCALCRGSRVVPYPPSFKRRPRAPRASDP